MEAYQTIQLKTGTIIQDRYLNMWELIDGLTVAPVANIPVTVYPDQITDYTPQILEHNTGEEVIMNYFDQESRQSGRHRIILLIILVFLVGISVSMVYYIRHNSYNGSSRQNSRTPQIFIQKRCLRMCQHRINLSGTRRHILQQRLQRKR